MYLVQFTCITGNGTKDAIDTYQLDCTEAQFAGRLKVLVESVVEAHEPFDMVIHVVKAS